MKIKKATKAAAVLSVTALALMGCSSQQGANGGSNGSTITLWTHNGGNKGELAVVQEAVDGFNADNPDTQIKLTAFPQVAYNDSIVAAASSKDLPCILDLDGPIMPNWAWSGYLAPLELSKETTADLLPSTQGIYNNKLYSVGPYDTSLAILARTSVLEKHNIRIPTVAKPWTLDEFNAALEKLKGDSDFEYPIDLSVWDKAEWWPYAYAPMLQSFGGDLVDRKTFQSAKGKLNGPEAVKFGEWFQSVFKNGWASKTPTEGGSDFLQGKVPMVYAGGWKVLEAKKAFGDKEVSILPPVDFGQGAHVGGGSWQWGVSSTCSNPEAANKFIDYIMQDKYLVKYSDETGNFPARSSALSATENYKEGGRLAPLFNISKEFALLRPATPGYAVMSSVFDKAMHDIMSGADVKTTLDQAVKDIDANIQSNDGYRQQ
ncbi:MAG: sugar ABC transporter substrate-binding protein [Arcanobacterium sp.]|nr:sugar ABC transporter substrate-binding protein [Arcanobacterium sp.]MDY5589657.1 sugar ABC transporter substrate-binding protein [Arcanobacterium sp.]